MSNQSLKKGKGEKFFDIFNITFMLMLLVIMLYPMLNVLAISLSSYRAYTINPLMIIPKEINLDAYRMMFQSSIMKTSYGNTVFVTIVGTLINVFMTIITAYPLSKRSLKGSRTVMFFIVFTMLFSGGIIPSYLLVRNLNLLDTLWSLILPVAINSYYLIILKTAFQAVPDSLEESAKIEGANEIYILFKIIVPVSLPAIATITLFYAVVNWNQYFLAVLYIIKRENWTLQILLKEIVLQSSEVMNGEDIVLASSNAVYPHTIRCASIAIISLPILALYPFIQKYFMKGALLGAVKG